MRIQDVLGGVMNYRHVHSEVLLEKLLSMQNELLHKKPLQMLIQGEKESLLDFANAEFIGISLQGRDTFYEFTCKLGEDYGLINLIEKAPFKSDKIVRILKFLKLPVKVLDADELCRFLKLHRHCQDVHKIMDGKKIVLSFLESEKEDTLTQSTVLMILKAENYHEDNVKKSCEVANLLWQIIAPFYDKETGIIYQHCIYEDNMFEHLSPREKVIAHALTEGLNQAQIAKNTSLSINTIKTHIKNIYLKYGVNSRIDFINHLFKR